MRKTFPLVFHSLWKASGTVRKKNIAKHYMAGDFEHRVCKLGIACSMEHFLSTQAATRAFYNERNKTIPS